MSPLFYTNQSGSPEHKYTRVSQKPPEETYDKKVRDSEETISSNQNNEIVPVQPIAERPRALTIEQRIQRDQDAELAVTLHLNRHSRFRRYTWAWIFSGGTALSIPLGLAVVGVLSRFTSISLDDSSHNFPFSFL